MYPTVIDTLRFADRLKAAGFDDPQAESMARALGDELADNMVTKRDLDDAVESLRVTIETMDAKFESRLEGVQSRFETMDTRFEGLEAKVDVRFNGLESKSDGKFDGLEPRFDAIDAKLEATTGSFRPSSTFCSDGLGVHADHRIDRRQPLFSPTCRPGHSRDRPPHRGVCAWTEHPAWGVVGEIRLGF